VRAATAVVHDALLVPQRAVNDVQGQSQVRVVGADGKVTMKTLTLGGRSGNRWIVEHGLDPGAQVIVDATTMPEGTIVRATRVTLDAANGIKGS
jgi:membrane fusion protein (multidrug efflux system)